MPDFYVYLIPTLPMLYFEGKPPFSFDVFLNKCSEFIPQKDLEVLKGLGRDDMQIKKNHTIRKFSEFDTLLRNELVFLRAARKKVLPEKYIKAIASYPGLSIHHIAQSAHRNPNPLEAEKILDLARWDFLDELAMGHYFDLDFLIVYGLKLLILQRWVRIDQADKEVLIEKLTGVR